MQKWHSGLWFLATLAFTSGTALSGEGLKFGISGSAAVPTDQARTLVDNMPGYTLGAFVLVDFGHGHVLRPRVDHYKANVTSGYAGSIAFPGSLKSTSILEREVMTSWSAGADYLRYLGEDKDWGSYFLLGVGAAVNRYQVAVNEHLTTGSASGQYDVQATKLYWNGGFGRQFNSSLGLEAVYHRSLLGGKPDDLFPSKVIGYVSLALTLRF